MPVDREAPTYLNPYANEWNSEAVDDSSPAEPYDARAKGIDGDLLDAMLKGRWQEGHEDGYQDGAKQARARYPEIFDEGARAGAETGKQEELAVIWPVIMDTLRGQIALLLNIVDKTSSATIKALCRAEALGCHVVREQLRIRWSLPADDPDPRLSIPKVDEAS